ADFSNYYSISLASFFRNDTGAGIGLKLGWNKFSCGIAFHDIDGKSGPFNESPFYFMSVNLFNLSQSKVEQYEKYRKTLEQRLKTINKKISLCLTLLLLMLSSDSSLSISCIVYLSVSYRKSLPPILVS